MTGRAPRVGVIGARRRRQGVGEHLARFVHEAGGVVVAVAGTSAATVEEARRALALRGIEAKGHASAEAMVEAEDLDAVVIASPAPLHESHLHLALDAGLHALCEKPLVLSPDRGAGVCIAETVVRQFHDDRLLLCVNTQWPFTLDSYFRLFPDARARRARRFEMHLSPASRGRDMLIDAMSHPLSLLAAADEIWGGSVTDEDSEDSEDETNGYALSRVTFAGDAEHLELTFSYPARVRPIHCRVRLTTCPTQPRPASYGFDGRIAHRIIREPGYRMSLSAGEGSDVGEVEMEDPMRSLVADFVGRLRREETETKADSLVDQVSHFEDVLRWWYRSGHVVCPDEPR